jgi:hypothetical protein
MCTVHVYDIGDKDMKNTANKTPSVLLLNRWLFLSAKLVNKRDMRSLTSSLQK